MRFSLTEDQELARKTVRDLLEKHCTGEHVRRAWDAETGRIPSLWERLASVGVVGLLAPESAGGMGLTEEDLVPLLEEAGRAALPEPLLETAAVAIPLLTALSKDARARSVLDRAAAGNVVVAVSLGAAPYVASADAADFLVAEHGEEAHLVRRADLTLEPSVDRSRHLFRVTFCTSPETCIGAGPSVRLAFADAWNRGALAAAAELVGLGTRLSDITIEYAKTREQFGQPIGAFQAVKHQLVDAHLGLTFARPLVLRAAHSMAHSDPSRDAHVSAAKALASDAAARAARVALQVHGAIGYSYEHDLHLFMKRVWSLAPAWGDAAFHRNRLANQILGEP